MNLKPELAELWQSAEWKTDWSRKIRRTEVSLRVVRVLLALMAFGAFVVLVFGTITVLVHWVTQLPTGLSIPVVPTTVGLFAAPAVATLLMVANARLQARRKRLKEFRLAREAGT
jgi:hypothetical protein